MFVLSFANFESRALSLGPSDDSVKSSVPIVHDINELTMVYCLANSRLYLLANNINLPEFEIQCSFLGNVSKSYV